MTTKTLTVISWTARILAVLVLLWVMLLSLEPLVVGYPDTSSTLTLVCVLLLLGIAAIPSRALSRYRVLSGFAFFLSLIPLMLLVSLILGLRDYISLGWLRSHDNLLLVALFCVLTIGVCSLPIALATADALARRGDPVWALGKWTRIVLLAVGGMVLILAGRMLTLF